jgi:hypothetical protein
MSMNQRDVRFGSLAKIRARIIDVPFRPQSALSIEINVRYVPKADMTVASVILSACPKSVTCRRVPTGARLVAVGCANTTFLIVSSWVLYSD